MMKIKITTDRSAREVLRQCPHCSGLGMKVDSKNTTKSCSTCKQTRKSRKTKHDVGLNIHPQKVSVIAVGNNKMDSGGKTPSLFGRLFSKSDKGKRMNQNATKSNVDINSDNVISSDHFPVTFLEIKRSDKLTSSNPDLDHPISYYETDAQHSKTNLCTKCNLNPPQVSVADSKGMKTQRLCRGCHALLKDAKVSSNQLSADKPNLDSTTIHKSNSASLLYSDDVKKTVIVVNDGKGFLQEKSSKLQDEIQAKTLNNSTEERLLQILEDFKTTVISSGNIDKPSVSLDSNLNSIVNKTTTTKVHTNPSKDFRSKVISEHSSFNYSIDSSQIHGKGAEKSQESKNKEGFPVTVLSLQSNKLQRSNTYMDDLHKNIKQTIIPGTSQQTNQSSLSSSSSGQVTKGDNYVSVDEPPILFGEDEFNEGPERPFPYNPDYRSTLGKASTFSLKMPSELEAVPPYRDGNAYMSKAEEILNFNRSTNFPPMNQSNPPRYEDFVKSDVKDPSQHVVYYLKSFGRYSEISTQPGGFSNPTTLKLSPNHQNVSDSTLVVTDPKLSNVQVFDQKGECLALVKVKGVKSCCQVDSKLLVVATDDWVALFDYNGIEKGRVNLDVNKGKVNSVGSMKTRDSFVMVAQEKMISIFDCRNDFMVFVKKVERVDNNISFTNIVDVAITSKENIVVLDSGALGGSGAIYVIDVSTLKPKSVIQPKHESCGSFNHPTAITVDRQNRILVADSGNRRILILANTHIAGTSSQVGLTKRSRIQVKTLIGLNFPGSNDLMPAGIDINNDDFIFLIVKGRTEAGVWIYSSH